MNRLYTNSEEADAKDNVVAAFCRLAQNYPTAMPFDQVFDYIMTKIPMTGDLNENATALKFAFNIYSQRNFNPLIFYL